MHETCALSYAELDATPGELVPERETLALVNILHDQQHGERSGRTAPRCRPVLATSSGDGRSGTGA
jgi:hypothetical protein